MKYIGLKNYVCEITEEGNYAISFKGPHGGGACLKEVGYKEADSIAELCDYVFFKDREGKLQIQKMFGGDKQIKSLLLDYATEIKLAILTKKGLNYVAKMNDKGELELL